MEINMDGRICMITGATSGMGRATAAALAKQGATVILVARNENKGITVRDDIRAESGNARVDVMVADLASQQAIRDLVHTFKKSYDQLHVLVNNAGGVFFKRELTVDGIEQTLAVDHLAYFLLTNLLLDTLKRSAPARIINVSSNAEGVGRIRFTDLQHQKRYNGFSAYAQAKLANLLFTYELARRLSGTGVTVNAVRPGPVRTNFASGGHGVFRLFPLIFRFGRSAEEGAQTAIYLASSPDVAGLTGRVFYECKEVRSSPTSHKVEIQRQLWQVSEDLTGLTSSQPPSATLRQPAWQGQPKIHRR